MSYFPVWASDRPIIVSLLAFFIFAMCLMLVVWRKHITYLVAPEHECPKEHLVKRNLFHGVKIAAIVLAITSIVVKF